MRAIIETGGMQFPVEEKTVIQVPKLNTDLLLANLILRAPKSRQKFWLMENLTR